MRVANNSLFNPVTNNIMRNQERFLKLGETISSGKRLHSLSTDPPALAQALRFRSAIASVGQYQENIDRAHSWLVSVHVVGARNSLPAHGDVGSHRGP